MLTETRLLPLAAIVTPATLSVQTSLILPSPSELRYVPNLDFRSLSFSATVSGSDVSQEQGFISYTKYKYDGPSLAVQKVAGATALEGSILSIEPPTPNSTWNIAFDGPSVRCKHIEGERRNTILQDIADHTLTTNNCFSPPVYLSWSSLNRRLPFRNASSGNGRNATVYIALIPFFLEPDIVAPWNPATCSSLQWLPNTGNWSNPTSPFRPDDMTIV